MQKGSHLPSRCAQGAPTSERCFLPYLGIQPSALPSGWLVSTASAGRWGVPGNVGWGWSGTACRYFARASAPRAEGARAREFGLLRAGEELAFLFSPLPRSPTNAWRPVSPIINFKVDSDLGGEREGLGNGETLWLGTVPWEQA